MDTKIFIQLALVAACLGLFSTACGGSSSETPPPLEPDPRGNNYLGSYHAASSEDADGGAAQSPRPARGAGGANLAPAPQLGSPARSTWGSGRGASPR